MEPESLSPMRRALAMASLILAGETIFVPGFYLGRYFRSSMMDLLQVDDLQLGEAYAIYGLVAMVCYLFGGPIADTFSPRKLLAGSLLVTGTGCLYMATFPSVGGLKMLYAFWGASSIVAFWSPLMRATREWGGTAAQGSAFGLLDGGRGLVAALIASIAAWYFAWRIGEGPVDPAKEGEVIRTILLFFFACCCMAALAVWVFLPKGKASRGEDQASESALKNVFAVASTASVWLQALVVLAAYSAFKTFDYYGLYCEDVVGVSKSESGKLIAFLSYLRVVSAILAGLIADRVSSVAGVIAVGFMLLIGVYLSFLYLPAGDYLYRLTVANMAVSCIAFFALRGIYFALMEGEGVPQHLTGTAVGLISFVGYMPEIFIPWVNGGLLDNARKAENVQAGYEQIFMMLLVFSIIGLITSLILLMRSRKRAQKTP